MNDCLLIAKRTEEIYTNSNLSYAAAFEQAKKEYLKRSNQNVKKEKSN